MNQKIKNFFIYSAPCDFDDCNELKSQFEKDIKDKRISPCRSCRRSIVINKYIKILTEKFNSLDI
jgi:hypothetical protein